MNRSTHYSDRNLSQKLAAFAAAAGRELVEKVLILYEVLKDSSTPAWARTAIIGALGYFISPLDVIPDFIPVIGLSDDFTMLTAAAATIAAHVKPSHILAARSKLKQWFGAKDGYTGEARASD